MTLERDGLHLVIPFELLTKVLNPRVIFARGETLTTREKDVLRELLLAKPNKEIANALNLSERTVKFHVSSLLEKYRVESRQQLQVAHANAEGERG